MMDISIWRWLALALMIMTGIASRAQSCDSMSCHCGEADLNPSGIMVGHSHAKGTWMLSYRYMNMRMQGNLSGTGSVSDELVYQNYLMSPSTMNMDMHMIMGMYGITDRLSVMAMLSYNVLTMKMNMLPGTMQMQMNGMVMSDMSMTSMSSKASGPGDTKLYAMYALLNGHTHGLVLSLGLNLPTGSIQVKGDDMSMQPGQRLPYMMQLGSGTYDLMPGLTYLLKKDKLCWGTQVAGTWRRGYNAVGYALGNDVTATTWLAYQFLPWLSTSARAEGFAGDRIYGRDKTLFEVMEPDAKVTSYGGQRASAYAGLNFYWKKLSNSRFTVEYGQPFYQSLNGPQLATRSVLYAGWGISF